MPSVCLWGKLRYSSSPFWLQGLIPIFYPWQYLTWAWTGSCHQSYLTTWTVFFSITSIRLLCEGSSMISPHGSTMFWLSFWRVILCQCWGHIIKNAWCTSPFLLTLGFPETSVGAHDWNPTRTHHSFLMGMESRVGGNEKEKWLSGRWGRPHMESGFFCRHVPELLFEFTPSFPKLVNDMKVVWFAPNHVAGQWQLGRCSCKCFLRLRGPRRCSPYCQWAMVCSPEPLLPATPPPRALFPRGLSLFYLCGPCSNTTSSKTSSLTLLLEIDPLPSVSPLTCLMFLYRDTRHLKVHLKGVCHFLPLPISKLHSRQNSYIKSVSTGIRPMRVAWLGVWIGGFVVWNRRECMSSFDSLQGT